MTTCPGKPAELYALPYIEGSLPEFEVERFEEHFFDCPVCLSHLQALQAVGVALARQPAAQPLVARTGILHQWPARAFALGAIAAALIAAIVGYQTIVNRSSHPVVAKAPVKAPAPAPQHVASEKPNVLASQLADLALPAFVAPSLRGESEDPRFESGMKAYTKGNCRQAIADLTQVPPDDREGRASLFYSGVCQMHLGNMPAASVLLGKVAGAGDSPQQEAALYYLAQISLEGNDPVRAHRYLVHIVSLRGDLEHRARTEDRQVTELIARQSQTQNPVTR
jgi:hypothetical protein